MKCIHCQSDNTHTLTKSDYRQYQKIRGIQLTNFYRKNTHQILYKCENCQKYSVKQK